MTEVVVQCPQCGWLSSVYLSVNAMEHIGSPPMYCTGAHGVTLYIWKGIVHKTTRHEPRMMMPITAVKGKER